MKCNNCDESIRFKSLWKWIESGFDDLLCGSCNQLIAGGGWLLGLYVTWGVVGFLIVKLSEGIDTSVGIGVGFLNHLVLAAVLMLIFMPISTLVFVFIAKLKKRP